MAKKKKHMDSGRVSFIVIPSTTARPWRGDISRRFITTAGVVFGIVMIAFLALAYVFLSSLAEVHHVQAIKAENRQKDREIQGVQAQLQQIEEKQESISSKQNQVKKMMGIKNEPKVTRNPSRGGRGGVDVPIADGDSDMLRQTQNIINSLDMQEKELDELLAKVTDNTDYFRSMPNLWPTGGEISSEYGLRDSPVIRGHAQSFHNGIDIANNVGAPVYAAGDGTVSYAGWKSGYGRMVIIEHGHGFSSQYGHLSAFAAEEGDEVKKGQVIGRVGTSGASTGPHLHFIITKNGSPVDPLIYLP